MFGAAVCLRPLMLAESIAVSAAGALNVGGAASLQLEEAVGRDPAMSSRVSVFAIGGCFCELESQYASLGSSLQKMRTWMGDLTLLQ